MVRSESSVLAAPNTTLSVSAGSTSPVIYGCSQFDGEAHFRFGGFLVLHVKVANKTRASRTSIRGRHTSVGKFKDLFNQVDTSVHRKPVNGYRAVRDHRYGRLPIASEVARSPDVDRD